jgi:2-(1,2-epoxy-1,2-dihydrophenyl)acetyl-CoA isomerase
MSTITIEKKNGIHLIKLNRPEVLNSFNREMSLALQDALKDSGNDESCRVIILSGAGRAFCAGQDLSEAISPDGPGIKKIVEEHYNPIITLIRETPKPVLGMVNGVAAGAGCNIALACDITFASEEVNFIQAFSRIGLIPDSGGTFFLPRLVGMQRAAAYMFSGQKVGAAEAASIGMIYQCVATLKLEETVMEFAGQLADMPTMAFAYTKQLLNSSMKNDLADQLKEEGKFQELASQTADHREGVMSFLEKRRAVFTGK